MENKKKMENKNTIKGIGLAAILGAASLMPSTAEAISGGIRRVQSIDHEGSKVTNNSYPELQMGYGLPFGVGGFTFLDFYGNKVGYFGKTALEKNIIEGVGVRTQIVHSNQAYGQQGFGLKANIPHLPKGISAKVYFMPAWTDQKGKNVKDKKMAGFSASAKLPLEFNLSTYGEWNTQTRQWSYGEIELGRQIKLGNNESIILSYNPALKNHGDMSPILEHRVALQIPFGGK